MKWSFFSVLFKPITNAYQTFKEWRNPKNETVLQNQGNSSVSFNTTEEWSQYNVTNMFFDVPSDDEETDSGEMYWAVWFAMVVCSVVVLLSTWLVLTRRRRFCNTAGHHLPSSTGLKVRSASKPRLQLTPDVIPQHSTATKSTSISRDPSQPEIIELKSYLLPYLSGRNEKNNERNHSSDNGMVPENGNGPGVLDSDRSEQRNIQLRPPAPTPHPDPCLNNALNTFRENSLYANIPNESNIYAVPRVRTQEEMLASSNREFVHVYEVPPDFVNSDVNLSPSTQDTPESFRDWFRRKFL